MLTPLQWIVLGAMFIPALMLVAILELCRWVRSFRSERAPVSEKLLRPAGESIRRELEKIGEQINDVFLWIFCMPPIIAASVLAPNPAMKTDSARVTIVLITGIAAIAFGWLSYRLIRLIKTRRDHLLGFSGERAVAEELNQLMLDGCRVFHDVPMDPYGNIDHIIVAPTGVYAVETKARRKRAARGKRDYELIFDGKQLAFPHGAERKPIHQARQQADRLRGFLSKAVGEAVGVTAILTFPGWFVSCRTYSELKVLNPKNIRSAVLGNRSPALPKQLLDRIAYQLDQRCRDLEF